jgi:hypothetical protein
LKPAKAGKTYPFIGVGIHYLHEIYENDSEITGKGLTLNGGLAILIAEYASVRLGLSYTYDNFSFENGSAGGTIIMFSAGFEFYIY